MRSMISYTQAAMERAMKVQEVILQALAKKITWWQAAEIIGISDRQMRRWRERYQEFGIRGLFDRRRGKPSPKRVPLATVEGVLELYRERYFDFNVRHFHEKLTAEHQIELSYSWVKGLLQGAGLIARGRKRGKHRQRRPRRPLPGMLLHIDGSEHGWFQDERWYDLIVILDDATSEIYYAQLVEEDPHRFRTKRQLWEYSGLGLETRDSGEYHYVQGQVRRRKKQVSIRGLNKDHNHDLKGLFKGAATRASVQPGPFQDFYQRWLAKGIKPTMARLTLARKIAAITLTLWKKGENFDAEKLKSQAA